MYQIFYKKKVIILTDVLQEEIDIVVLPLKNLKFKKLIKFLNKKNIKSVHLFHKNRNK